MTTADNEHDLWRPGMIAARTDGAQGAALHAGSSPRRWSPQGARATATRPSRRREPIRPAPRHRSKPSRPTPPTNRSPPRQTRTADTEATETDTSEADDTTEATDAPTADAEGDFTSRVPALGPATGEPLKIGLINSEGVPGLDFPEIRINTEATFAYLNEHGGYGGRPLELVSCASKASPETSQSCAQEIAGSDVELVLLGLDLFPSYPTFEASGLPVIGLLPLLPGDYTADALFVTGGNATLAAGMAGVAAEQFDAQSVGIISADAPGSNGTEAALIASLDMAGIEYTSIKGGTEETDAGFQGLMSQANAGNPDLLVSLYDGPGCIGTMRGRTSLGITTPVLAPSSCAAAEVIEQVGDEALGWIFLGAQTNEPSAANDLIGEIMSPVLDVPAEEIDPSCARARRTRHRPGHDARPVRRRHRQRRRRDHRRVVVRLHGIDQRVDLALGTAVRVRQGNRLPRDLHLRVPGHRVHRGRHPPRGRRPRDGLGIRVPPVSVRRRR